MAQQIQWFPGHMAKTLRELREEMGLCDCIVEVCDARIPRSSRNPELLRIAESKTRLLLLNKEDLADAATTEEWLKFYAAKGQAAMATQAQRQGSAKAVARKILELNEEKIARARSRGRINRPIRCFVAGIPNCGKSTLVNSLVGRKAAATSNKPGVTRSLSWLKAGTHLSVLDTPGLLWPKVEEREAAIVLGACAAIKDDVMPLTELAGEFLLLLCQRYAGMMEREYGLVLTNADYTEAEQGELLLEVLARNRGLLRQGSEADLQRAARHILTAFRSGSLGHLSLESPEQE